MFSSPGHSTKSSLAVATRQIDDVLDLPEMSSGATNKFSEYPSRPVSSVSQSSIISDVSIVREQIEMTLTENSLLESANLELERKLAEKDKFIDVLQVQIEAYKAIAAQAQKNKSAFDDLTALQKRAKALEHRLEQKNNQILTLCSEKQALELKFMESNYRVADAQRDSLSCFEIDPHLGSTNHHNINKDIEMATACNEQSKRPLLNTKSRPTKTTTQTAQLVSGILNIINKISRNMSDNLFLVHPLTQDELCYRGDKLVSYADLEYLTPNYFKAGSKRLKHANKFNNKNNHKKQTFNPSKEKLKRAQV